MYLSKLNTSENRIIIILFVLLMASGQAIALDTRHPRPAGDDAVMGVVTANRNGAMAHLEHPGESSEKPGPDQEKLRLGERMYREGKLPSGASMQGFAKGDIPVDGSAFSCASCHQRGGLGVTEGGVTTPPVTGAKLFQPYHSGTILTASPRSTSKNYAVVANPTRRLAYTEESLAIVLRNGKDPVGRKLDDVMPRYPLRDEDMALLIHYLGSLCASYFPGVDDATLRLATIITDGVTAEDRRAMLEPLENFIAAKNSQAKVFATRARYMRSGGFSEEMNLAYRKLSLARWELKGRPETWRDQLEALNRKEPVFAFIGGIGKGQWKPIHDFCEAHRIPSLFPVTDFPVISDTDWYTMYFSKGLYQEGEAAARFLGSVKNVSSKSGVVQIVRDSPESRALSAGFMKTWRELGNRPPVTVSLPESGPVGRDFLLRLLKNHKPTAILLWTGPEILAALEPISKDPRAPRYVFAASGYLQKNIWNVPEKARGITYLTYPYRLPQEDARDFGRSPVSIKNDAFRFDEQRISTRVQAITEILQSGLLHMNRNYYRDTFLDVISMIPDQEPTDYERLSFGPGQRYASKGCNIVQLTEGKDPVLVRKSDWVIH